MVMDRQRTLQNARPSRLPGSDFLCNTFPKKISSPPANTLSPITLDTTHKQSVALDDLLFHVNVNHTIERFTPLDGVTPNDNICDFSTRYLTGWGGGVRVDLLSHRNIQEDKQCRPRINVALRQVQVTISAVEKLLHILGVRL